MVIRVTRGHASRSQRRPLLLGGLSISLVLGLLSTPASAAPTGVPPSGIGGSVAHWGTDSYGVANLPEALTGKTIIAIEAGYELTLALTSEGQVIGWGDNDFGQAVPPSSLAEKTVTAISAGLHHSMALTTDGQVTVWGDVRYEFATPPATLRDETAIAVSAGETHSLALTAQGKIVSWGRNNSYDQQSTVPESLAVRAFAAISAGGYHSIALTTDGEVVGWGRNSQGQSTVPDSLSGRTVKAISAGRAHNLALTENGEVVAWGSVQGDDPVTVPASLSGKRVIAIAAGGNHSLALTDDGQITAWGGDDRGQSTLPESLDGRTATAISAGNRHSVALVRFAPPVISASPVAVEVTAGTQATFTAEVTSEGPATTRWQRAEPGSDQFVDLPDVAGTTYTTPALTVADSGARYRLVATSPGGEAFSDPATVTVVAPATISGDAPSGTATVAYDYAYTVAGAPAPAVVVEGQLPPGLSISAEGRITGTPSAAGTFAYTVRASNAVGSATLNDSITIAAAPAREANLAVRVSGPASAQSGKSVTYQIVVTNNGPATATNVKTVLGASSFSVKSTKPSTGSGSIKIRNTPVSGSLWTTPTLAAGASVTFEITGQFTAKKGQIAAVAGGSLSSISDPALTNNIGGLAVRIT